MNTEGHITPHSGGQPEVDFSMRAKQLVACVRQGRSIGISVLDEGQFTGYLAGWDEDTYFLLEPQDQESATFNKLLIPKGNILFVQMNDAQTFRDEPAYEDMERIVKPFRDALNKLYVR